MSETLSTCLLCSAPRLHSDAAAARELNLTDDHGVTRCRACGLRFLNPRPTRDEYESIYRNGSGPLAADYRMPTRYYADEDLARIPEYRTKLDFLRQAGAGPRMLEIGACTGVFLNEARLRSFDVQGIEPSEANRRIAESRFSLLLRPGLMEDQDLPDASFDVVFSSNVFEHLLDPLAATVQVCRWLRPGGLLMLEVPNQFDSFAARRRRWIGARKTKDRSFLSVHHPVFFSRRTLRQLVVRAGLEVCRLRNVYYCSEPDRSNPLRMAAHLVGALAGGSGVIEVLARKREKPLKGGQ